MKDAIDMAKERMTINGIDVDYNLYSATMVDNCHPDNSMQLQVIGGLDDDGLLRLSWRMSLILFRSGRMLL